LRTGIIALGALGAASAVPAQSLPNYVTCSVSAGVLGTNGALRGGAVGDFDGNGTPDLVLVGSGGLSIALTNSELFAQGKCPEAITRGSASEVQNPGAAAVGFINSDNVLDLAVTTGGTDIALLLGDGHGAFTPLSSGTRTGLTAQHTIAIDRLLKEKPNNEGPDIVVGNRNTVVLMFGRTDTTYVISATLTLGNNDVKSVRLADFNGDSQLDIAAVDLVGDVRIFLQTQPGVFVAQPTTGPNFAVGGSPQDMQVADPRLADPFTIGDLNRDFIPDLVFITLQHDLRAFLGRRPTATTVTFDPPTVTPPAGDDPSALALGDLDGDGKIDAVVTDKTNGQIRIFLGDGAGHLTQSGDPRKTDTAPSGVLLADLDDDGQSEIITTHSNGGLTIFLSGNPPPTPIPTVTPSSTAADTPTETPTPTDTGTPTDTPTATPTITPTGSPTATGTPTQTGLPTGTVTSTFGGFEVIGQGCADISGGNSVADAMPLVVLAALIAVRFAARRRRAAAPD